MNILRSLSLLHRPPVKHLDGDVVLFKGRPFPDATIPGDRLWVLRFELNQIIKRAAEIGDGPLSTKLASYQEKINSIFDNYNKVCKAYGLGGFESPDADTFGEAISGTKD